MAVKIKRKTGFAGSGTPLTVKVNGEKIGKIGHNQEIVLDNIEDNDRLQISQFLSQSKEIKLNGDETVQVSTPKLASLATILSIIAIPLISIIVPNDTLSFTLFMVVLAFIIVVTLVKPQFQLEVIDKGQNS